MIESTIIDVRKMRNLIITAINQLIVNDSEILHSSRNLGEMAINHRLAVYIESHLEVFYSQKYFVDMEYDRNYAQPKLLIIDGVESPRRPDILVHTRTDNSVPVQHLLVIEAKKKFRTKDFLLDTKKIKAFMRYYDYQFGMTVLYRHRRSNVAAKLYYFDGQNIACEEIIVSG